MSVTDDPDENGEDPFDSEEWLRVADRALSHLVPLIEESATTIALVPEGPAGVEMALEIGLSVLFDKPLIVVLPPGCPLPRNLAKIASAIVELTEPLSNPRNGDRVQEAIKRVMAQEGRRNRNKELGS